MTEFERQLFLHPNPNVLNSRAHRMTLSSLYTEHLDTVFRAGVNIPPSMSLKEFTTFSKEVRKAEKVSEKIVLIDGKPIQIMTMPTLGKNPAERDLLSEQSRQILQEIDQQTSLEFLQMYIDTYMAPHGISDIKYRLGHVTSIKTNTMSNILTGLPLPLCSPQANSSGALFTRANLATRFRVKTFAGNKPTPIDVPYINLFFPPYTNMILTRPQATLLDLKAIFGDPESQYYVECETTRRAIQTFDNNKGLILRPDFTYREPGFKALTDNINMLQFLFEQITGIVSTYLNEWDLSVYLQEGLLNQGLGGLNVVYLLHRIMEDNPMAQFWPDRRALAFGNVNCAVSKLFKHNEQMWEPGISPMSPYHAMYSLFKSPHDDYPSFYDIAASHSYNDLRFQTSYSTYENDLQRRIELSDYKQAAASGWSHWGIPFWKIFYTTPEDGMSPFDTILLAAETQGADIRDLIDDMADAVEQNGGTGGQGGSGGARKFPLVTPFGAFDFQNGIPRMRKRASSGNAAAELAKKSADGYSPAAGMESSGDSDTPQNKKTAPTTGIPQKNPTFYGGPHGVSFSPKTVQGYFQLRNLFLRDQPRISGNTYGGFTNSNPNAYNDSLDRMYYEGGPEAAVDYGKSDQCPAYGMHRFYKGDCSYTIQTAFKWVEARQVFRGKMIWRNRPCSADFSHITTGPGGGPIVRWLNDLHFGWHWEWQYEQVDPHRRWTWWGGSYFWYWNKWARRQFHWNASTRVWSVWVGTWSPYQTGVYLVKSWTSYKRYVLANFTDTQWVITKFNMPFHTISLAFITSPWSVWSWWFHRQWARIRPVYTTTYRTEIRYRLHFPGPMSWTQYMGNWHFMHSVPEREIIRQIFGCSTQNNTVTAGHATDIILCEGSNQSYNDRIANGPMSMFKIRASLKEFYSAYRETWWTHHRRRCRRWSEMHSRDHRTKCVYIDVDPDSLKWYRSNLNRDGWSNRHTISADMLHGCVPTNNFQRPNAIWESLFPSVNIHMTMPTANFAPTVSSNTSVRGYGVLSNIPGVVSDAVDNEWEKDAVYWLNYGNYIRHYFPNLTETQARAHIFNMRFQDIPRPQLRITQYDYAPRLDAYGNEYFFANGIPTYSVQGELDAGLKKAISRLFLNATFYPMENAQFAFIIGIDSPIRMLLNQLTYQTSFLEQARDFLFDTKTGLSFPAIKDVLENCVDEKTVNVSRKVYDASGNVLKKGPTNPEVQYDPDDYKYNYWIDQACEFFEKNLAIEKQNMILSMNNRIGLYQHAIDVMSKPVVKNSICEWTWNEIKECFDQVFVLKNSLTTGLTVDNFMYMYLNILYEYRKYFINKRFNKNDGTMWMMRHLESIMPMFAERANIEDMPSLSDISKDHYNLHVSYYDVQNTLGDKVEVFQNPKKLPLDADRITRVYIKVQYVTKREYDLSKGDGSIIKIYKPVYQTTFDENGKEVLMQPLRRLPKDVFKGYAIKPSDGHYYLESKERITWANNVKFNETLSPNEQNKKKFVRDDIDFAHWNITWGNEVGKTPIFFDMFEGVATKKLNDLNITFGPSGDVMIDVCNCKVVGDFWTVCIPSNMWPRASGYLKDVMLLPYYSDPEKTTSEEEIYRVVAGAFAYQLYPITEQQSRLIAGEVGQELIEKLKDNTLSTTMAKADM